MRAVRDLKNQPRATSPLVVPAAAAPAEPKLSRADKMRAEIERAQALEYANEEKRLAEEKAKRAASLEVVRASVADAKRRGDEMRQQFAMAEAAKRAKAEAERARKRAQREELAAKIAAAKESAQMTHSLKSKTYSIPEEYQNLVAPKYPTYEKVSLLPEPKRANISPTAASTQHEQLGPQQKAIELSPEAQEMRRQRDAEDEQLASRGIVELANQPDFRSDYQNAADDKHLVLSALISPDKGKDPTQDVLNWRFARMYKTERPLPPELNTVAKIKAELFKLEQKLPAGHKRSVDYMGYRYGRGIRRFDEEEWFGSV